MQLDESQVAAIDLATRSRLSIITGGPGTGKTTICKQVIEQLGNRRLALCSPTGKAAIRLAEQTGRPASTIHRLLSYNPILDGFLYGNHGPDGLGYLPSDVVIADEASMIDLELGHALFKAIDPDRSSLILVGDVNQLPSVGAGALLRDLIAGGVPTARLTTIHRQIESSSIPWIAKAINEGLKPNFSHGNDAFFVDADEYADVANTILRLVTEEIPRRHSIRPTDIQVISPQKAGPIGVWELNTALQQRLNPPRPDVAEMIVRYEIDEDEFGNKKSKQKIPVILRCGDRVIHTRNRYDLGVMNGETGTIAEADPDSKILMVDYGGGKEVKYSRSDTEQLELAYAMTVHKSQGSEYEAVVAVVHHGHYKMLRRQLVYTAATRARAYLYMVGQKRALSTAIRNNEADVRHSGLAAKIAGQPQVQE